MTTARSLSRGDQTREQLILAALDVFGHSGFDAASTRAIARQAGVNQALIGYHFGGKQGLYLAVFEHIVSQIKLRMVPVGDEVIRRLQAAPAQPAARRELALELMLLIFDTYTDMISDRAAAGWVRLILREQQDPTEAFQLLYDTIFSQVLALVARLVAVASDVEPTVETCRVRAMMLLGQVVIFFIARGTTARYLEWEAFSPATIATLKQQFHLVLESQFRQGVTTS